MVLLAAAVAIPARAKAPAPADFFPLRAGDWWRYRVTTAGGTSAEFTVTVLRQERKPNGAIAVVMETRTDKPVTHDWYAKAGGWVLHERQLQIASGQSVTFEPPKRALRNPPQVGDRWEWKGTGLGGVDVETEAEVADVGTVEAPAGTFRAVRVSSRATQDGVPVTRTLWYAAGVGLVRSESDVDEERSATELVDYSFRPKAVAGAGGRK